MQRTLATLQHGIDSGLHPGAQIYVSQRGRPLLDTALGHVRPGVAMTRDSLTLWMSAGKPVTAVAVLQLIDRGRLTLDTRIADVIPEFGLLGKDPITVRHCLTHTAGFRGPLNNFTPGTWHEILERVYALKQEPGWTPGEKAGYHIGSSWFVLGELVRRIDGRTIDAYVCDELFARLGEPDASIGLTAPAWTSREQDVAQMFNTSGGTPIVDPQTTSENANTLPRPGANARGPIRSLGRLYESLLRSLSAQPSPPGTGARGPALLSPAMARAMASRQRVGMTDQTFKQIIDWGLGVMIDSKHYAGEHQYGFGPHALPDAFGHSGNQSSCAFADPRHDLVVAWTCNGMPGEAKHQLRATAINAAIYEDLGVVTDEQ